MFKKTLFFISVFFYATQTLADTEFYSPGFSCDNITEKDKVEWMICTDENLAKLNKEIIAFQQSILDKVLIKNNDIVKKNKESQRPWVDQVIKLVKEDWIRERNYFCKQNRQACLDKYQSAITRIKEIDAFFPTYKTPQGIQIINCKNQANASIVKLICGSKKHRILHNEIVRLLNILIAANVDNLDRLVYQHVHWAVDISNYVQDNSVLVLLEKMLYFHKEALYLACQSERAYWLPKNKANICTSIQGESTNNTGDLFVEAIFGNQAPSLSFQEKYFIANKLTGFEDNTDDDNDKFILWKNEIYYKDSNVYRIEPAYFKIIEQVINNEVGVFVVEFCHPFVCGIAGTMSHVFYKINDQYKKVYSSLGASVFALEYSKNFVYPNYLVAGRGLNCNKWFWNQTKEKYVFGETLEQDVCEKIDWKP